MIIHREIEHFRISNPVVTVGIFDGVHLGHRYILENLVLRAGEDKGESVVLTLWPHPRMVLDQQIEDFGLLSSLDEKAKLLDECGIDHLVILPFTKEFSRLTSCEFIESLLVGKIGIRKLLIGYNHRFGKDREGDFNRLKSCADQFGFDIEQLEPIVFESGKISSSEIRESLRLGNIIRANHLLGRSYSLLGRITGGSKIGRSIGYPTANIIPGSVEKLVPGEGVYAVKVEIWEKIFNGMMNIGRRPTVNSIPGMPALEVHILDFNNDIYEEEIRIHFIDRIRDEHKFDSLDALKHQLGKDRQVAERILKKT